MKKIFILISIYFILIPITFFARPLTTHVYSYFKKDPQPKPTVFTVTTSHIATTTTVVKNTATSTATSTNIVRVIPNSKPATSSDVVAPTQVEWTQFDIFKAAKKGLVYIEASTDNGFMRGSGIVVEAQKDSPIVYILTTADMVVGTNKVTVYQNSKVNYAGVVMGRDQFKNIALVRIYADDVEPVSFADLNKTYFGDTVYSLGYSKGIGGDVDFNDGIFYKRVGDTLYASLKLSSTNGGPLVNQRGEVIGIQTGKYFINNATIKAYIPELKAGRQALYVNNSEGDALDALNKINVYEQQFSAAGTVSKDIDSIYGKTTYEFDIKRLDTEKDEKTKIDVFTGVINSNKELIVPILLLNSYAQFINAYAANPADFWSLSLYQQQKIQDIHRESSTLIAKTDQVVSSLKNNVSVYSALDARSMSVDDIKATMKTLISIKEDIQKQRESLSGLLVFTAQAF